MRGLMGLKWTSTYNLVSHSIHILVYVYIDNIMGENFATFYGGVSHEYQKSQIIELLIW